MKKVFSNEMVAHVWAQRSQDEGRNAKDKWSGASSFYFAGDTIYSYGPHFPIARFVDNDKGAVAVLVTIASYSNTTNRHQTHVWRASHHHTTFHVAQVEATFKPEEIHTENMESYKERVEEMLLKAARARKNTQWLLEQAVKLLQEANGYATFFGLEERIEEPENMNTMLEQAKENEKVRKVQEAQKRAVDISEWREFTKPRIRLNVGYDLLRLNADMERIETTGGAQVPVEHAKKMWPLVKRCHDRKQAWQSNGSTIKVGYFQVNHIEATGNVRIGCHYIKYPELQSMAVQLGLTS
ncbi:MAG: hypothetical protein KAJ73_00750 [Zetaproteobacteria bacterium]|nr:hypothetical protein [Zetaproteobacteria bacterium]